MEKVFNPQIVVLAGGLATRLGELSKSQPKSLVKINNKPFLQYQLEIFKKNGISRVLLCLGYLGDQIESYFGTGSRFGMEIKYSYENKPLSTAGAIKNAEPLLEDEFFTIYGDSYVFLNFADIYNYFQDKKKLALMTVYRNNDLYDSSNTVIRDGLVTAYNKHQKTSNMHYIEYGVNLFRKDILNIIPEDSYYELGEVFNSLIIEEELLAYEVKERFYEIGSLNGLADFKKYIGE
jgi:NDP-sugar pyrophosphorylase family protein